MIVINSGKMRIPEEDRFIGFCGDNLHSTKQFKLTDVTEPDCIYRLYLSFDDGTVNYFVLDSKVENGSTILTWNILEEHIFKSGTVQAQIKCICADGEIYHTTSDYFIVADVAENSEFFSNKDNSEFLRYERILNALLESVSANDNSFVTSNRKIAGLSLSSDITVDKLREALSVYPVLTFPREPDKKTVGLQGQIAICGFATQPDFSIYYCCGEIEEGEYTWLKITDVSKDYVESTRTIAGLELSSDITAQDLQTALSTYPVYVSSSLSEIKSDLKVGQLGLYTAYDGKTWTRDIYYRFANGVTLIGGTTFNNNMLPSAIEKYLEENPATFDDMYAYAKQVQSAQSPTTLTLALMADTHYCGNDTDAKTKLDIAKTMGELSNYVNVDVIANLGDMVRGDEEKATTQKDLAHLISSTNQNAKCPVFYLRGNHDDNGWYSYGGFGGEYKTDEILSEKEWYQTAFGFSRGDVVIDTNKLNGGYGYYDHDASKIRVFLLNTSDIPYVVEDDGTYRYNAYQCWAFSNEQLNFVANALKFEDKEKPDEWAAMFLMHIPLDTTTSDGYRFGAKHEFVRGNEQMLSIITAYKNGTSYKFEGTVQSSALGELSDDFAVNIDVDYSDKGVGDVICFVNGHTHIDNASHKVGVEGSLSYGYTYLSVIGMTAFATMVIDREKNTITTFKFGDVQTASDMSELGKEDYVGVINGEEELVLDMKTGVWEVPFDQFRPTDKNLYRGLSKEWDGNYLVDISGTLDLNTGEVTKVTENDKYKLSKAVPIKQSTQYIISPDFTGEIYTFNSTTGAFVGAIKPTEGVNCKIVEKDANVCLVFAFHISYTDYENFYIKENVQISGESNV